MTLRPSTYRGWTVNHDPRPLWDGAAWVATNDAYETSLSGAFELEMQLEVDDFLAGQERRTPEGKARIKAENARIRSRADAEWPEYDFWHPQTIAEHVAHAGVADRAATEWATLHATLNEQAAYRRDEARIRVERSRMGEG